MTTVGIVMSGYRPTWHAGGTCFCTENALQRHGRDLLTRDIGLLRVVFRAVRARLPFTIHGWFELATHPAQCPSVIAPYGAVVVFDLHGVSLTPTPLPVGEGLYSRPPRVGVPRVFSSPLPAGEGPGVREQHGKVAHRRERVTLPTIAPVVASCDGPDPLGMRAEPVFAP